MMLCSIGFFNFHPIKLINLCVYRILQIGVKSIVAMFFFLFIAAQAKNLIFLTFKYLNSNTFKQQIFHTFWHCWAFILGNDEKHVE